MVMLNIIIIYFYFKHFFNKQQTKYQYIKYYNLLDFMLKYLDLFLKIFCLNI